MDRSLRPSNRGLQMGHPATLPESVHHARPLLQHHRLRNGLHNHRHRNRKHPSGHIPVHARQLRVGCRRRKRHLRQRGRVQQIYCHSECGDGMDHAAHAAATGLEAECDYAAEDRLVCDLPARDHVSFRSA